MLYIYIFLAGAKPQVAQWPHKTSTSALCKLLGTIECLQPYPTRPSRTWVVECGQLFPSEGVKAL